jgi:lipopolysaccharide transport system ATP-binding protein
LKDISFEVKSGEVVGIIGRNGAGKTTLLKILSRITEPTEGWAEIRGRVGSLLEVGTGFHPELTGRENIYLNGAILGMKKAEINRKFGEIVAFAEVEKFIDTPIKRYSSGMYVRLAFAVAAHLEPEILLVDEVLAVGDVTFQKKCLGKMGEVAGEGRTVLFVSHNMTAIGTLCSQSIWIDKGKIVLQGTPDQVVQAYLSDGISERSAIDFETDPGRAGQITSVSLMTAEGKPATVFEIRKPICIEIGYEVCERLPYYRIGVVVRNMTGVTVFISNSSDFSAESMSIDPGTYLARITIPGYLLNTGMYTVTSYLGEPNVRRLDTRENAIHFEIIGNPYRNNEVRRGLLAYPFEWVLKKRDNRS